MFLSPLGDAIAIQNHTNELDSDAPLLVSSAKSLSYGQLPRDWSGSMYMTKSIIEETGSQLNHIRSTTNCTIKELTENVPTTVQIYRGEPIKVTAIPIMTAQRGSRVLFLVEDMYISRLCADSLADNLSKALFDPVLRKAIIEGIDVLHVDNMVYCNSDLSELTLADHPSDFQLRSLAYIVRPRKIVGLHAGVLPKYILNCCRERDFFIDPFQVKVELESE